MNDVCNSDFLISKCVYCVSTLKTRHTHQSFPIFAMQIILNTIWYVYNIMSSSVSAYFEVKYYLIIPKPFLCFVLIANITISTYKYAQRGVSSVCKSAFCEQFLTKQNIILHSSRRKTKWLNRNINKYPKEMSCVTRSLFVGKEDIGKPVF